MHKTLCATRVKLRSISNFFPLVTQASITSLFFTRKTLLFISFPIDALFFKLSIQRVADMEISYIFPLVGKFYQLHLPGFDDMYHLTPPKIFSVQIFLWNKPRRRRSFNFLTLMGSFFCLSNMNGVCTERILLVFEK